MSAEHMKQPLTKREPAQLIALVIGIAATIGTFLTQLAAEIGPESNWQKIGLSALLLVLTGSQGLATREVVYSPATYEKDVYAMRQADGPQ